MRAREFIVEYREDITKRQYGEAIIKQMLNGPDSRTYTQNLMYRKGPLETRTYESSFNGEALLREAFAYIGDGDPTYNWAEKTGGMYIPWIAREYAKGNIKRLEDCPSRVNAALGAYHKYKAKRDFKERYPMMADIMRVDWDTLEDVMRRYEPPAAELKDRGRSETIYDGPDSRVIMPEDQAAACYYGQGTRWCTASTKGQNLFNYYNERGRLYIILPKNPTHQGEKYQIHTATSQYMDINDRAVELHDLYERYPEALKAIAKRDPKMGDMVLFADPKVVVGVWNAISDLVVGAAERLSKKPMFSTDLTDTARKNIEEDVETIRMKLYDKTYDEIMADYTFNAESTIPYLKRDIYYQITQDDIDEEFRIHVGSYLDYTVAVIKNSIFTSPDMSDSFENYEVYKTIGDWVVALKPQRQHWARKKTKVEY